MKVRVKIFSKLWLKFFFKVRVKIFQKKIPRKKISEKIFGKNNEIELEGIKV